MHVDQLTRMANQIGQFFEAMPERDEARRGAVQHIRNFWEPRMRRALLEHLAECDLSRFMAEAIEAHGHLLDDGDAQRPARAPLQGARP